jgi:rSAM/selenodomain-associated transferase 2
MRHRRAGYQIQRPRRGWYNGEGSRNVTSIVVPTLNEEQTIGPTLAALESLAGKKEIIVVDGGSSDATMDRARPIATVVLQSERGRGPQMHAGARAASGDVLWFVHADTMPPSTALCEIDLALAASEVVGGNFGLVFDGSSRSARQLTMVYPWLRLLGLCYGDAGIFVRRSVYESAGGFRSYALFEDLDLIRRIKRFGTFVHLPCSLTTSSRRFENRNFGLVWANWIALQALYWMGVSPNLLARWYRHVR